MTVTTKKTEKNLVQQLPGPIQDFLTWALLHNNSIFVASDEDIKEVDVLNQLAELALNNEDITIVEQLYDYSVVDVYNHIKEGRSIIAYIKSPRTKSALMNFAERASVQVTGVSDTRAPEKILEFHDGLSEHVVYIVHIDRSKLDNKLYISGVYYVFPSGIMMPIYNLDY